MKVRTDCYKCRQKIHEEETEKFIEQQYKFLPEVGQNVAEFATVVALSVMLRRGRSKEYIRKFFDEMVFMFDFPPFLGKRLTASEMQKKFEDDYGIDFKRIKVHFEEYNEFKKSVKELL